MSATAGFVLLVEDDGDIRDSVSDALKDEGYAVVEAIDGLDALERLRGASAVPSLILLDLMMPRMNGVQFRAELLTVERWAAIPVILLTADAHARAKAEALGVSGCLKKPVRLDALFSAVASFVRPGRP